MPPPPPMPQPGPDHAPPADMTAEELEAAVVALPGKRDALREAFDRLAACSPTPLPFAWADIDAHVSSLQSSISLRVRQVRALEAVRPASAAAVPRGTRGDGTGENLEEEEEEEVVEVEEKVEEEEEEALEVVEEIEEEVLEVEEFVEEEEEKADEEMQEGDGNETDDKIGNDGKDEKEAMGEVLQEEEAEEVLEVEEVEDEEEEVLEVEEEKADEEMQEGGGDDDDETNDKIGKDGKDKEAIDEVLQEEEVAEPAAEMADDRINNDMKDDKEAVGEEQAADEEMLVDNEEVQNTEDAEKASQNKVVDANMEEEQNTKDAKNVSQDKEDASMEDDQDTDMEEAVTKKASATQGKEEEACGEEKENQQSHEEEVAKNVAKEEAAVANETSQDQGDQALPGGFGDHAAACGNMDAQRLIKLLFTTTGLIELQAALHRAPDAAALALHIVELFLHDKMLKTNQAWVNCVGLVRMVPVVVTELSADTIEQAKPVAKDWKEMIGSPECCTDLGILASWGLLYFLISYNIVSEFETKEIFRLFATMPRKQQKMNYAMLFKDLRLTDRIPELMDYLIENGQQMDVLYWARIFNLVDKYPPASLLKGYVEKAKQTAIMTQQSLSAVIKELDNLRRAQVLAERHITDSSLSTSIMAEISDLLEEFENRKKSLAKSHTTSTSNSQQKNESNKKQKEQKNESNKKQKKEQKKQKKEQKNESNKKQKKEQDHEGQGSQQQGQQSKPGDKLDKKLDKPQQKQQKKLEDKPREKQQQSKQQHTKRPRQHTPKLSAWASPMAQNAPLRNHFGHQPYAAIHGVYHGYPAQPGWPGVPCVPPFAPPQPGAPEYIMPFNHFNPHPEFHPW